MNKNFKYYLSVWAILFVLFNVVVFVAPAEIAGMSKFGGAFWTGYIFITLAFIGQLVCSYLALKAENLKKLFYNIPLISISWTGLVLTLIFGALCMAVPNLPNWIGIILCFLVLGFTAISVIKAKLAADLVEAVDDKIKVKTEFIKILTADAEHLINIAKTTELKAEAKKVYETIRYSDPMSNVVLIETENKIQKTFADFRTAVTAENLESAATICVELMSLIDLRNKKSKVLK
ncbi:MAG: hypothetical protein IKW59_04340 [Clostridia bacterium]|nr:hypothetical protein [Clostridia bacterium]